MNPNLIFTNNVARTIDEFVEKLQPSDMFVHVDVNTAKFVMPILESQSDVVRNARKIVSQSGDINKNLEALNKIWQQLSDAKATRSALLINLGGGVVTDLGGLAAATYKRGIKVLNVPTSLLGAVDASVGGKTSINFNGIKNQIGVFNEPEATLISTCFFQTLPQYEKLAGYAEMIKHGLLKGEGAFKDIMKYDITVPPVNPDALMDLLKESVLLKKSFVDKDPDDRGLRKALNFGHTVAHALESFAMNERHNPIAHGFAVAQGLVVESILSNRIKGLDSNYLHLLSKYVREIYTPYYITCDDYPKLLEYMHQDKKNLRAEQINFTLLSAPGKPVLDVAVSEQEICNALDIYRDLMGL